MKRFAVLSAGCVVLFFVPLGAQEKGKVPSPFEEAAPAAAESAGEEDGPDPFDPDVDKPKMVQVMVECIEMPHEVLTDLLFENRPASADATELRRRVQGLVKEGTAKVLETQVMTARSGNKSLAESIREQIWPTEVEPPYVPERVVAPGNDEAMGVQQVKALSALVTPPTPTSFETTEVGSTLEIEPTIGADGKLVDLRFAPNLLWHEGNTVWQERTDSLGNKFTIEMPDFYTIRMDTSLTLISGQYAMAGTLSPKDAAGKADLSRKVMVFVKADILVVK